MPDPIKVVGIAEDKFDYKQIDNPKARFEVPFRLSSEPTTDWTTAFLECWSADGQPKARIEGDILILEDVELVGQDGDPPYLGVLKKHLNSWAANADRASQDAEKAREAKQEADNRRRTTIKDNIDSINKNWR